MEPETASVTQSDLTYEETPIIQPVVQETVPSVPPEPRDALPEEQAPSVSHPTQSSFMSTLGTIFLFLILFTVGVGISVYLRQYMGSRTETSSQPSVTMKPLPTVSSPPYINNLLSPTASPTAALADLSAGWVTYHVISGSTKQPIPGVTFQLPSQVLAPICDGGSCASQGTYLSGGSRFTVAARGNGQLLVDARGNVALTDSSGKPFTVKQVTLSSGRKALDYSGLFSGTTVGGYTFSQMRGLMIEIDEDESLEMNHFAPSGVTAEFAKDDVEFDKIVASLMVARFSQATTSATQR